MTERVVSRSEQLVQGDGSPIPARLRIVAWITLSTGLALLAVVLTIRSALLADVERGSNDNIAQEIDEFRTFAAEGLDPETGEPFGSGVRLLELYLQRQFPGRGEVLAGWDLTATDSRSAALLQDVDGGYDLDDPTEVLEQIIESEASSGVVDEGDASFRWGKTVAVDAERRPVAAFVIIESSEPARADVADIVRLVTLVCLGGLLLTMLIAFAVAGAILAPVRAVREAAAKITRTDIGQRIETRGRDDVSALAATFNAMLDRLEVSFRAQHRFVRTADAHIKHPLETVVDRSAAESERLEAAHEIRTTLDDMTVLTASQLPGFATPVRVEMTELARRLEARLRERLPRESWTVDLEATGHAHVDEALLETALTALAHNASAHQPPGLPLGLGTAGEPDHVELWISDQGPGLDRERAAQVLDRFTELQDPEGDTDPDVDPYTGYVSGLGLAVVRAVADAHEGSAWVETEPGQGSRFGLRLPRGVRTPPREREDEAWSD